MINGAQIPHFQSLFYRSFFFLFNLDNPRYNLTLQCHYLHLPLPQQKIMADPNAKSKIQVAGLERINQYKRNDFYKDEDISNVPFVG